MTVSSTTKGLFHIVWNSPFVVGIYIEFIRESFEEDYL
jgi:hypothetical protein